MADPVTAQKEAFRAGTDAISAATEAAAAAEVARSSDTAALLAKVDEKLSEHHEENKKEMKNMLLDVLGKVFGEEENTWVVPNRVPMLCQKVAYMKDSITEVRSSVAEMYQMMKDLPKEIDSKYASKITEKIVFSLVGIIVLGFMLTVSSFVFTK